MRFHSFVVPIALALIAASTPACKKPGADKPNPAANAQAPAQIPAVQFAKVEERKLAPTLEASGTLAADETSEVASPGSGIVTKVEIDVGARVKKGDVLVQLDSRDPALRAQAADASAAQALAKLGVKAGEKFDPAKVAEVRAAKEGMDLAVDEAERTKKLYESGAVAQATWDQARTRAEQARAQYESALNGAQQGWAGLAAAQSQANLARKAVADMAVRAPFDGAVAEKRISVGEFASMGRVVAVLVRDKPLRLRIDIPEADAGKITEGKEVSLSVSAHPGRVFKGVIKLVGASVKAQSRALPVEAVVPNDDGLLKPGYFARAYIELGSADTNVMLVPRAAIGTSGSASRVFVRAGNRVVERIVTIGREIDGFVEIRGSISPNEEVAIDRVDQLQDGAEVNATATQAGAR
jgi:RND family efflux transporter MFP subunit